MKKFQQLRADLNARFPERRSVIDGALAAVLAGEHVLLLGPPGTAKSALVRAIAKAFDGIYFEHLLTRFTTPEELFGPISLKGLEQDRFERVIAGKLPEAELGSLDEVFKAGSAILNSLLALVNERIFHNGAVIQVFIFMEHGMVNFRLFFGVEVNQLGVTAVFKIGDAVHAPSMFIVPQQGAVGHG